MPKRSISAMAPKETKEKVVVEDVKPYLKSNEIDEIFAGKKRKKPEGKKIEKSTKYKFVEPNLAKRKKGKKNSEGAAEDGFADAPTRPRRKTEDGLTIYTEEELGFNNADAGNTPLCPFDCSCCF